MDTELNHLINTTEKYTAATDGIPVTDHSQQMNYGLGMASRAATHAAAPPPAPPAIMPPITPVAN